MDQSHTPGLNEAKKLLLCAEEYNGVPRGVSMFPCDLVRGDYDSSSGRNMNAAQWLVGASVSDRGDHDGVAVRVALYPYIVGPIRISLAATTNLRIVGLA